MGYGIRGKAEQESFRVIDDLRRILYSAGTGPNCPHFLDP